MKMQNSMEKSHLCKSKVSQTVLGGIYISLTNGVLGFRFLYLSCIFNISLESAPVGQ